MQEARYLGRLEPGMDVCDVDGNKFGSIGRVYRLEMAAAAVGGSTGQVGTMPMPREEILEVKTGLFGLGKHMYIPFSAIQDVTSGCVFINQPKDHLEQQGWDVKPDYLEELS
jgi:hypothetical protein